MLKGVRAAKLSSIVVSDIPGQPRFLSLPWLDPNEVIVRYLTHQTLKRVQTDFRNLSILQNPRPSTLTPQYPSHKYLIAVALSLLLLGPALPVHSASLFALYFRPLLLLLIDRKHSSAPVSASR